MGIGAVMFWVGCALMVVGALWLLFVTFKESIIWGICSLFIPLVQLLFVFFNWELTWRPFFINLVGVLLMVGSFWIGDHQHNEQYLGAYIKGMAQSAPEQAQKLEALFLGMGSSETTKKPSSQRVDKPLVIVEGATSADAAAGSGTIYKCKDKFGSITFSDKPCPSAAGK